MDKDHNLQNSGNSDARVKIKEAVSALTKSHCLSLCQVWTYLYGRNEHEKRATKLGIYYADVFKDYYNGCVKIDDGSGGLALKALETYQTYFSRSIITKGGDLHPLLPVTVAESSCCLALCLRNENLDYVFEFIFSLHDNNNPYVFLDSLVLKLRSCLPSFIFSFDANIERQSLVLDVDTLIALEKQEEKEKEEEDCKDRKFPRPLNMYVDDLQRAKLEIQEAVFTTLIKTYSLTLCQVWFEPHEKDKCPSKIGIYHAAAFKDYYDACVNIQDGSGGLALKSLKTYNTYFSRNIVNGKLHSLIPATSASEFSCCLSICLNNIYTGNIDYAFEFFFSFNDRNNIRNNPSMFLESLLLTLHSCLPSFKCFSSAQFCHNLRVLDSDNPGKKFSFLASKKQQFGALTVPSYIITNDKGNFGSMDVRFYVPSSTKFAHLKMIIGARFHMFPNTYRVTYSFQGLTRPLWIQLESDQDFKMCIRVCRRKKITQLPIRVVPAARTVRLKQ